MSHEQLEVSLVVGFCGNIFVDLFDHFSCRFIRNECVDKTLERIYGAHQLPTGLHSVYEEEAVPEIAVSNLARLDAFPVQTIFSASG